MSNPVATYLHDHLAGAMHAVDLLTSMRDHHAGEPIGELAAALLPQIEADRDVLREIAERAGAGAHSLKEAVAWLGEKVSRLKLRHHTDAFGTFEALEFLVLGIHGKWTLWRALAVAATVDERFRGTDFEFLAARAQAQHDLVEERRLQLVCSALVPATDHSSSSAGEKRAASH